MSQDFTDAKLPMGGVYPDQVVDGVWQRVEPLVDVKKLKDRHLAGIPLVSGVVNPNTRKREEITDDQIKEKILDAVATAELELGLDIFPTARKEKYPFDRPLYESLGYLQLTHKPVMALQKFSVTPSNGVDVYVLPLDWVETAYLPKGQINIIPLTISISNAGYIPASTGGGGAAFLSLLGQKSWIPAYWEVDYITGFPDSKIPRVINLIIGMTAAIDILSMLAATYARTTSKSVSIDGLSQSQGGPGPQMFDGRIKLLQDQKAQIVGKLKNIYGTKLFVSNV
jgi:hypothetical protein